MIAKILKLFAGSHYKRFYKKARPLVAKINKIEEQYQSLTDEQLRAKTDEFRARYAKGESLDSMLPEAASAAKPTPSAGTTSSGRWSTTTSS